MEKHYAFLAEFLRQFQQPVVILDLEATNSNALHNRITEIAYLRFENGQVKQYQKLLNPQADIHPFVAQLTQLNNEMLQNEPIFHEIAQEIQDDLRGCLLIAHQSQFDYGLLMNEFRRAKMNFACHTLCSVQLSKKLYPNESQHNLDIIAQRFNIPIQGQRHRAMTDVLLLADFLQITAQQSPENWFNMACELRSPKNLSGSLPENLRHDLHNIGDEYGVVYFFDENDVMTLAKICQLGHSQTITLLNQFIRRKYPMPHRIAFKPAIGELHALFQLVQGKNIQFNKTNSEKQRVMLNFVMKQGCLKAEINEIGQEFLTQPPTAIYYNDHAAQNALIDWTKKEKICLHLLGYNPHKLDSNSRCPKSQIGSCSVACHTQNFALHNSSVQAALNTLPKGQWQWQTPIIVREKDPITQEIQSFWCENGALWLPNETWYCSNKLVDLIRKKARDHADEIQIANMSLNEFRQTWALSHT